MIWVNELIFCLCYLIMTHAFSMIDDNCLDKYELCNHTRHLEREWEDQGEVIGSIFEKKMEMLVSLEELFIYKSQERKGDQILFQIKYCFGASWSKPAVELLEHGSTQDCSIGLLHSFGFILLLLLLGDVLMMTFKCD
ncbi:hypothetical protein SAY86_029744 [Trapa natans]|uniref:Uncharacterized protein n=1 Tax=Trapa natans TaxID=22666 RepID=A0AAN7RHN3_TRANT|nr:hypothetical protein SAY86_029744 [Trapa natans]